MILYDALQLKGEKEKKFNKKKFCPLLKSFFTTKYRWILVLISA
jgi:hypothetical protein